MATATRALLSAALAVKSVTVIPVVNRPAVSTSTRAGAQVSRPGAATAATAQTSCTAGPSGAAGWPGGLAAGPAPRLAPREPDRRGSSRSGAGPARPRDLGRPAAAGA